MPNYLSEGHRQFDRSRPNDPISKLDYYLEAADKRHAISSISSSSGRTGSGSGGGASFRNKFAYDAENRREASGDVFASSNSSYSSSYSSRLVANLLRHRHRRGSTTPSTSSGSSASTPKTTTSSPRSVSKLFASHKSIRNNNTQWHKQPKGLPPTQGVNYEQPTTSGNNGHSPLESSGFSDGSPPLVGVPDADLMNATCKLPQKDNNNNNNLVTFVDTGVASPAAAAAAAKKTEEANAPRMLQQQWPRGGDFNRLKRRKITRNRRMMNAGQSATNEQQFGAGGANQGDFMYANPYALSELFSQSEIPGFREIFASDSYLRKFCWIVAFLFMTVLSLNDMTELITEYYDYPITVDVRLRDSARLPFPAVTVCNLNTVRFSWLCSNSRLDLAQQIPSELRDKLCGIQVEKKRKQGPNGTTSIDQEPIGDINHMGGGGQVATTTTTTTTAATATNATPQSLTTPSPTLISTTTSGSSGGSTTTTQTSQINAVPAGGGGVGAAARLPPDGGRARRQQRRRGRSIAGLDSADSRPFAASGRLTVKPPPLAGGALPSPQNSAAATAAAAGRPQPAGALAAPITQRGPGHQAPTNVQQQQQPPFGLPVAPADQILAPLAPAGADPSPTTTTTNNNNNNNGGGQFSATNSFVPVPGQTDDFEPLTERQERELQESLTNWLAVMHQREQRVTRSLGHQFDDMILRCTMKSINCTRQRSFEISFSPTEGNCFTYRSKVKRIGASASSSSHIKWQESNLAGTSEGLELVLNLEKNEYISGSSQVGALVMIHHPSDLGYAASEATFIAPEFTTYIGLKMVNITRLPAPYPESCVDSWPAKFADTLTRNSTYSQQACLKICLQLTIQSHCACQSAFLPIVDPSPAASGGSASASAPAAPANNSTNSPATVNDSNNQQLHQQQQQQQQQRIIICDTRKPATRQCVREVNLRTSDRVSNCECPPKCQVVRYDKTISMARWPTREDKVSFDRGKMDVNFQNLAKVIVYFQTMTCEEVSQQAVFNAAKLFSALGGIMGMYVGFSFLSVFEILEVVSRKLWHYVTTQIVGRSSSSSRLARVVNLWA